MFLSHPAVLFFPLFFFVTLSQPNPDLDLWSKPSQLFFQAFQLPTLSDVYHLITFKAGPPMLQPPSPLHFPPVLVSILLILIIIIILMQPRHTRAFRHLLEAIIFVC